jgi:hypothetical protein
MPLRKIHTGWSQLMKQSACCWRLFRLWLPLSVMDFGYSVLGVKIGGTIGWGLRHAISQSITMIGSVYVAAFVIDMLAETFGTKKDFNRAFSLVAYSFTPMFIAGVFYILPSISWLASLAGLYGLYLLYIGLQPMMKAPDEKQTSYFVVSLIVMTVAFVVVGLIVTALLLGSAMRF